MSPTGSNKMTTAQQAAAINSAARAAIQQNAVKMQQQLTSGNLVPANQNVLTVQPRNVGLLLGFYVNITHTILNGSAVTINLTDFGPLNALAQIQLNDFNNTTRIQTPGWHLGLINSIRARRPFGTALVRTTGFDAPTNYGSNWTNQISASATIAAGNSGTVNMWYWVPLAYSDNDLRGSIYANVVNATMQLLLTMPGSNGVSVAVANGTDSTQSMYVGAAAGSVSAVSITNTAYNIYQYYYDQLPISSNGVLLPVTDLATVYELKSTLVNSIQANQDFGYQYANFRNFLSTIAVYVNTGATGARGVGADINYWALQAANTTNIWKKVPGLVAHEFRNFFSTDLPPGCYYFGTRQKPIITTQFGNMQLILNASTAGAANYELVAVEDFALIQTLSMAGSLPTS
jgi:P3 major capsid protein